MRNSRNVKGLLAELDRRDAELGDIEARVRELDSRYQAVWAALTDDRPLPGATRASKGKKRQSRKKVDMCVEPKDVDLTGANTRLELLVRIAKAAPNNEVNLGQATKLMIAAGVISQSKFDSTRTTLYNAVRRRENGFRRVRSGWYRLTPSKVTRVHTVQWREGDIDYAGCLNISQRLVRMAGHTVDGRLEPEQTAQRLLQDGQSSQRLASLVRLVTNSLRKLPHFRELDEDLFELSEFPPRPVSQSQPDTVADMESGMFHAPRASDPNMTANRSMNGNISNDPQEASS